MKLKSPLADIYVPDERPLEEALKRTTHLAVGAHQDDIEIMAYHGIATCYGAGDQWFSGITVTDGSGSPRTGKYKDCSDEEMKDIRFQEQKKAALEGKYSVQIQLRYESKKVKDLAFKGLVTDLFEIFKATKPNVVYLHNPADKHPTHVALCMRSIEALRKLSMDERPKKVYGCEVWRSLDWLSEKSLVPLSCSDHPELAEALVKLYDSQIVGGKRYDLAVTGRRYANATFFETHHIDQSNALAFAMDLMPLINDHTASVEAYVMQLIDHFKNDAKSMLRGVSKN